MRKVAIIAKAGTSALAPWHDAEWEIWGMPWVSYPRVTRLFEPHCHEVSQTFEGESADDAWMPMVREKYKGIPVYCDASRMHYFEYAVEYPLEEIKKFLPIPYLENSIAYMLALALYESVNEIGLWGVHMMGRDEFNWQRASLTYLIGLAQGMGVSVSVAPGSPLFMSGYVAGRYGVSNEMRNVPAASF